MQRRTLKPKDMNKGNKDNIRTALVNTLTAVHCMLAHRKQYHREIALISCVLNSGVSYIRTKDYPTANYILSTVYNDLAVLINRMPDSETRTDLLNLSTIIYESREMLKEIN